MVDRVTASLYGLMLCACLALTGCIPASTSKPADIKENPGKTVPQSPPPSSLEALRRGHTPITPSSSALRDIHYDFNDYGLRADAREILKANADWLKANPSARVEIEGHCDERGTNEFNLALGAKRARAAKDYLVALGVPAGRLPTISYGEELPVCNEHSEECWQENRRVRFVVLAAQPAL